MPCEPATKRCVASVDGQNLFYAGTATFGHRCSRLVAQEKGVDVRIALDLVRLAREKAYDVACAFPSGSAGYNRRGVGRTDWIRIDRATYDACLGPKDYRRPSSKA